MNDNSEMVKDQKEAEVIDLRVVIRTLWHKKKLFLKVWAVVFILSCVYILPKPRTYTTSLTLAPEAAGQSAAGGTIGSLASSFGIDLGSAQGEDAFYPELYPDVMATNEFIVGLLNVQVHTADGSLTTTYLDYLAKHQQKSPWEQAYNWCKKKISSLGGGGKSESLQADKPLDPRCLSKVENALVEKVRQHVTCDVDIKTNVITITVEDQDPDICVQIADSARVRLQDFITSYRTNKARVDMEYYRQLADSSHQEYLIALAVYSDYCDRHQNTILQSYASERDQLENDMSTKLSTYNAMQAQYQAAKAKVQERTPAFTLLQPASVPLEPSAPKRMIFVATMLFLAFFGTSFWIFRKSIARQFLGGKGRSK